MHRCLNVDDILKLLACELVESGLKVTAVSFACCCRRFEGPFLDELWRTQDQLTPLLACLPQEVWAEANTSMRVLTEAEWDRYLRRYARRIQHLKTSPEDLTTPRNSSVLEHYATKKPLPGSIFRAPPPLRSELEGGFQPIPGQIYRPAKASLFVKTPPFVPKALLLANEPLLPNLKSFECRVAKSDFVPFIPLLLSPQTTKIVIDFSCVPPVVAMPLIRKLSTLCPNLEHIFSDNLGRGSIVVGAVSEMLLACNRNSLREFIVNSPLTEEAREVVCQLPKLSRLLVVVEGHTELPRLVLPNLTEIVVIYDDADWLEGFRGATLDKLESINLYSWRKQIDGFLGAFESVAQTSSIQNTISSLVVHTQSPWIPDYLSLCSFNQLKELDIKFACGVDCPSGVNDNDITTLARAMPKLEDLRLGAGPCKTPAGVTTDGLVALASCCLHLSKLRIHFRGDTLVDGAAMNATTTNLPVDRPLVCALTHLKVGGIPIPAQSAETVARVLLRIFPRILNIKHHNPEWKGVLQKISELRQSSASEAGIDTGVMRILGTGYTA